MGKGRDREIQRCGLCLVLDISVKVACVPVLAWEDRVVGYAGGIDQSLSTFSR